MDDLHDSNPKQKWDNSHSLRKILWLVIYISLIIIISIIPMENWSQKALIFILVTLLGVLFYFILKKLENEFIHTIWDDADYSGLIKKDFPFEPIPGEKIFAYIYHNDGIKLDASQEKFPAIIGLHGWGASHREMDRYCLPFVKNRNILYFTYDDLGSGLSSGDKNDFKQFENARKFIDVIHSLPYVDKSRVGLIAMSLGAAKGSVVGYTNPKIKSLVLLSGVYDLQKHFTSVPSISQLILSRKLKKMNISSADLRKYSGINYFKSEGIVLFNQKLITPNKDRVFLCANRYDGGINWNQTAKAIEKLKLPPENYRIFMKGDHRFEGNEFFLAVDIFQFLDSSLLGKKMK
ncbi:MAG: alpha/beta hydrolase [Promethearchaeota archaeon]